MTDTERTRLLRDLHRGLISRNRAFDLFEHPEARRVLGAYRTLRDLVRDLGRPGVRVRTRWVENPGGVAVAVEAPGLRYRRVAVLPPWAVAFLESEMGPRTVLRPPPRPSPP